MMRFIDWFNQCTDERSTMCAVTIAGMAMAYFSAIQPFEGGNGRMARAIAEKALARSIGRPSLLSMSEVMATEPITHARAMRDIRETLDHGPWLKRFADWAEGAQGQTREKLQLFIQEIKLFDRLDGQLNRRQERILLRMFQRLGQEPGDAGSVVQEAQEAAGGSPAAVRRDLADLVDKGVVGRSGERGPYRLLLPELKDPAAYVAPDKEGPIVRRVGPEASEIELRTIGARRPDRLPEPGMEAE